jgi:1-acyl-sn-glycerol-3-phosphate acyltransferase
MKVIKIVTLFSVWAVLFAAAGLVRLWISIWRPRDPWRIIAQMIRRFVAVLSAILGIRITVQGDLDIFDLQGAFITANHLGYLDGFVLGSLFPAIFVTKREVRRWPVIGLWTALCGCVYIDRQRKGKITLAVEEIVERLNQKANILIFPEGTSTNGEHLLPFQTAPFAAPLRAHAPVVPLTISYRRIDGAPVSAANRDKIYWYGDMAFMPHLWGVMGLKRIEVSVQLHTPIETAQYKNNSISRKQLSQACHNAIAGGLAQEKQHLHAPRSSN